MIAVQCEYLRLVRQYGVVGVLCLNAPFIALLIIGG